MNTPLAKRSFVRRCNTEISKVSGPNLVTYLNQTTVIEWCVGRCGSKNGLQKDMFLKEIWLRAQDLLTILDSIVSIIAGN